MNSAILLVALVSCGPNASNLPKATKEVVIQTTKASYENDLQLVRMGWFNHMTGERCRARRVLINNKRLEKYDR